MPQETTEPQPPTDLQGHLLILEELVARSGRRESALRYDWVPQAIAFGYYQLSWLLYVNRPAWSYRLNADFEDHAEHEYMEFVAEHPEWETEPFESAFSRRPVSALRSAVSSPTRSVMQRTGRDQGCRDERRP